MLRFDFIADEFVPAGGMITLVSGLPVNGDHDRKIVVPDGHGGLFVNLARRATAARSRTGSSNHRASQFPKRYQGGLFAAWHGSRFDPSLQPAGPGFVVTFKQWHKGQPRGRFDTFADNFAGGDPTPAGAAHRPVGLAQATDGSLYVSDDKAGWIWRIFYIGPGRGQR